MKCCTLDGMLVEWVTLLKLHVSKYCRSEIQCGICSCNELETKYWQYKEESEMHKCINCLKEKRKDYKHVSSSGLCPTYITGRMIIYSQSILMDNVRFLQANLQFSKTATQETINFILHNKIDIAIIQDPYCCINGRVFRIPSTGHCR